MSKNDKKENYLIEYKKEIDKGNIVVGQELYLELENLINDLENKEYYFDRTDTLKRINFMQIKGHVHDGTKLAYYNNEADILAGEYRQIGLELHYANGGKKNKKAKKFWKKHGGNGGDGM